MSCLPWMDAGMMIEGLTLVEQPAALRARAPNSSSITAPSGIQAGDLLIMVDHVSGDTYATPTGWTNLASIFANGSPNNLLHQVHYKIADGSESGTSITGISTTSGDKLLVGFRGNKPMRASPMNPWTAVQTSGNPTPQNVPAASAQAPLVVIGTYGSAAVVNPRTMSPAKDDEYGSANGGVWVAWKFYLANPQNVSVDMDNEFTGFNLLTSGYITLS